ncbi:hypothetical protein BDW68DRAFT_171371 [Aspergillus falconensis]
MNGLLHVISAISLLPLVMVALGQQQECAGVGSICSTYYLGNDWRCTCPSGTQCQFTGIGIGNRVTVDVCQ